MKFLSIYILKFQIYKFSFVNFQNFEIYRLTRHNIINTRHKIKIYILIDRLIFKKLFDIIFFEQDTNGEMDQEMYQDISTRFKNHNIYTNFKVQGRFLYWNVLHASCIFLWTMILVIGIERWWRYCGCINLIKIFGCSY